VLEDTAPNKDNPITINKINNLLIMLSS